MSKAHAIHNNELCDHLLKNGKFNDWVITSAFYSALHYCQYEMFPFTDSGGTFAKFEDYFALVIKKKRSNKHAVMRKLVSHKIPAASPAYRWLLDACMNSRYHDYQISAAKAQAAKKRLEMIKKQLKRP